MDASTKKILSDAQMHLAMAVEYAQHGLEDQLVMDAVCMRLAAGIEALSYLDESQVQQLVGPLWPMMWSARNRIAQGYMFSESDELRHRIQRALPILLSAVQNSLKSQQRTA